MRLCWATENESHRSVQCEESLKMEPYSLFVRDWYVLEPFQSIVEAMLDWQSNISVVLFSIGLL